MELQVGRVAAVINPQNGSILTDRIGVSVFRDHPQVPVKRTLLALVSLLFLAAGATGSVPGSAAAMNPAASSAAETPIGPSIGRAFRSNYVAASLGSGAFDTRSHLGGRTGLLSGTRTASISLANGRIASAGVSAAAQLPTEGAASLATTNAGSQTVIRNGTFDDGLTHWFSSYLPAQTQAAVINVSGDHVLAVSVDASEGAVAQDVAIRPVAGRRYTASIRAESATGFPVLVELAVHALTADGSVGESASRLVMVEGYEVPITTELAPVADHRSLRVEVYVHTVDRPVQIDDVWLAVDGSPAGTDNYGYHQPRVRYVDDPVTGRVDLTNLVPGAQYHIEINVDTTTDQPWLCCTAVGAVRLGTEDEDLVGGSARTSQLFVPTTVDGSNWISPNRIRFDRTESTIGGSFTTLITAPSAPGPFAERFRLVAEDVTWIPGPVIEVIGNVGEHATEAKGLGTDGADNTDGVPNGDGSGALLIDCPPSLSIAAPDAATSDCATEIPGFDLRTSAVGAGFFMLEWIRPAAATVDLYLVEVQDLGVPIDAVREATARTFQTGALDMTVEVPPGRYSARVVALDGSGRWVRSGDVIVEVAEPAPIFEANVPTLGCRSETGTVLPGFCPPDGSPEDGPINNPAPSGCENVPLTFEQNVLMRYRGKDRSNAVAAELGCSRYEVQLTSSDERHALGYQSDQNDERWFLEALNADGDVIYRSEPTPDLSDHQTEATFSAGIADLTGAVSFQASHLGGGVAANSVTIGALLIPVG